MRAVLLYYCTIHHHMVIETPRGIDVELPALG